MNSFAAYAAQNAQLNASALPSAKEALLHELQLGEQLNECISQTRRADFSLMLAMLAPDVREQSQFLLPKSVNTALEKNELNQNAKLRLYFQLPPEAPLALKSNDEIALFNQAELIEKNNIATLHLTNSMNPKPLAFRDNPKHIESNVITNTSLYCQLQHAKRLELLDSKVKESSNSTNQNEPSSIDPSFEALNKALNFNAKGWLKGIEDSLVKAPLIA